MLTAPDFDAKKILIIYSNEGEKISFSNDNIVVKDISGKLKLQYTCYKIFAIYIVGGVSITSGLIEKSKKFGFSIVLMNTNFKVYETLNCKLEGNTLLRSKQYNTTRQLDIAKSIISNKIVNQRYFLSTIRNKSTELKQVIELLDKYITTIYAVKDNYELMGIEGIASKIYFKQIFKDNNWKGRQPRVKKDIINLLLDIGYTVLFNFIDSVLNIYGFDIYKGNLHQEFFKRKSLVCDMIEPFRCIIDYKIRKMYNLKQIDESDFFCDNGRYQLEWKNSAKYIKCFVEEIVKYKMDIFNYVQAYYRWFIKEKKVEDFPFARLVGGDTVDTVKL